MPKYHDRLVADMGLPTCRKSNPLSELLMPYNARDYSDIFGLTSRTTWMRVKALVVGAGQATQAAAKSDPKFVVGPGVMGAVYAMCIVGYAAIAEQ